MDDAQRYRMNAAECLSAAERCEKSYRGLTLAIAASWLSLERHQQAMDALLSSEGSVTSTTPAAFQYARESRRDRITALQEPEAISA
jgi:hypothetical protein